MRKHPHEGKRSIRSHHDTSDRSSFDTWIFREKMMMHLAQLHTDGWFNDGAIVSVKHDQMTIWSIAGKRIVNFSDIAEATLVPFRWYSPQPAIRIRMRKEHGGLLARPLTIWLAWGGNALLRRIASDSQHSSMRTPRIACARVAEHSGIVFAATLFFLGNGHLGAIAYLTAIAISNWLIRSGNTRSGSNGSDGSKAGGALGGGVSVTVPAAKGAGAIATVIRLGTGGALGGAVESAATQVGTENPSVRQLAIDTARSAVFNIVGGGAARQISTSNAAHTALDHTIPRAMSTATSVIESINSGGPNESDSPTGSSRQLQSAGGCIGDPSKAPGATATAPGSMANHATGSGIMGIYGGASMREEASYPGIYIPFGL